MTHSTDELQVCLASLERLNYPHERFQVALVDCRVIPGLAGYCAAHLHEFDLRVRLLVVPDEPRNHPQWLFEARMNEARNIAMATMPADCFVFTEDDCWFAPEWLDNFARRLTGDVGLAGGPDVLPEGLGGFASALDFVLNSRFGSGRMRHGDGANASQYFPRKQNMAVPAKVIERTGTFAEDRPMSGEIDLANRVRKLGMQVVYLADNPVWHRRVTDLKNFFRLSLFIASENVKILRGNGRFFHSLYFAVLIVTVIGTGLALAALTQINAALVLKALIAVYLLALVLSATLATLRNCSFKTGLWVLILIPAHHASIVLGTLKGSFTPIADPL